MTDLAECDAIITVYYKKLKDDPEYDPKIAWNMINRWLDVRLDLMEKDAVQGRKRRKEMLVK